MRSEEFLIKKPPGSLRPDGSFFMMPYVSPEAIRQLRTLLHIINISLPVHPHGLLGTVAAQGVIINYEFISYLFHDHLRSLAL
ncbi:MAG: hypothetical protein ACI3ZY_04910, partial [Parabacteroides sp.]